MEGDIEALQMAATQVTKAEFLGFLKMTWKKSLLGKHLQSGFKPSGLHPLSNTAVPNTKLSGSQCIAQVSTPKQHSIEVISHCSRIQPHLTPLRVTCKTTLQSSLLPRPSTLEQAVIVLKQVEDPTRLLWSSTNIRQSCKDD